MVYNLLWIVPIITIILVFINTKRENEYLDYMDKCFIILSGFLGFAVVAFLIIISVITVRVGADTYEYQKKQLSNNMY